MRILRQTVGKVFTTPKTTTLAAEFDASGRREPPKWLVSGDRQNVLQTAR
jgi:hypothetical protein